jgi:hypothetical protein
MKQSMILTTRLEPIRFTWNGKVVSIAGKAILLPETEVKHLHARVLAVAKNKLPKVPFYGRIVGCALYNNYEYTYFVEDDDGNIERVSNPQIVNESEEQHFPLHEHQEAMKCNTQKR